jgi:hypothetical protein
VAQSQEALDDASPHDIDVIRNYIGGGDNMRLRVVRPGCYEVKVSHISSPGEQPTMEFIISGLCATKTLVLYRMGMIVNVSDGEQCRNGGVTRIWDNVERGYTTSIEIKPLEGEVVVQVLITLAHAAKSTKKWK